jgi:hypothetical protein
MQNNCVLSSNPPQEFILEKGELPHGEQQSADWWLQAAGWKKGQRKIKIDTRPVSLSPV